MTALDDCMVMSAEMLARYEADPDKMDGEVREHFHIPKDKYYTVTIYPPHLAGRVKIERHRQT